MALEIDIDELIDAGESPGGKDCRVGWNLARIEDEADRAKMAKVSQGQYNFDAVMALWATRARPAGPVTSSSLTRHRQGKCRCPRA